MVDRPPGTERRRWLVSLATPQDPVGADLEISADADAAVVDLIDAARAAGLCGREPLELLVTDRRMDGRVVDDMVPLTSLGLRHGDRLILVARGGGVPAAAASALHYVLSLRRPDGSSEPVPLGSGRVEVGRSTASDVVVDDPSVSRHHATLSVGEVVTVSDHGSKNGTYIDSDQVHGSRVVPPGSVVRFGAVAVTVDTADCDELAASIPDTSPAITPDGHEPFNRPPRVARPLVSVELTAPELPATPTRYRLPWISAAIPVVMAGAVVAISTRSPGGFSGSYALISAAFLLLSPLMIVASYLESRRSARLEHIEQLTRFAERLDELSRVGYAAAARESATRLARHPGNPALRSWATARGPRLWEAGGQAGLPAVRVGFGVVDSAVTLAVPTTGDETARAAIATLAVELGHLGAPIVVELDAVGSVAVIGDRGWRTAVLRSLVLQLATLLPPDELDVTVIGGDETAAVWDFVKWVPGAGQHAPRLIVDDDYAAAFLDRVAQWLRRGPIGNDTGVHGGDQSSRPTPLTVIVVDRDAGVSRPVIEEIVRLGVAQRCVVVWSSDDNSSVPTGCGAVIDGTAGTAGTALVRFPGEGRAVALSDTDLVDEFAAVEWARSLAPLVDVGATPVAGAGLPEIVRIGDVLGGDATMLDDPDAIRARWALSPSSLRAPVGLSAGGVLPLDLGADGPHGIIAGTTGAGKSELLQSFVVAMAATHPPDRVTFLLVDYKGGAAFGACEALPHSVGVVTDLDSALVQRVLISLRAELRRRERLLAEVGAKDLDEMTAVHPALAPPSLVIVVDEFASLTAEVPEFIDGVVDIARRGRSLGLHLLLATQRPAGVIGDNLRANATLRIALRVADPPESIDVIGVATAAAISRSTPGRAVARLGDGALVEFQTAFCGYRALRDDAGVASGAVVLAPFAATGDERGFEPLSRVVARRPGDPASDLQRLVTTIAAASAGMAAPHRPWLEPLPVAIPIDRSGEVPAPNGGRFSIGLVDEPERQARSVLELDLDRSGSVAIIGRGEEATRCAESIAIAAVLDQDPDRIQVDVIQGVRRGLDRLGHLPQVGSVVMADDDELVGRVMAQLRDRIRRPSAGPRRLLVIDDFAGLAAHHDPLDGGATVELVARLVADGRSAGVHVLIVADRRSALPSGIWGAITTRIVLPMSNDDESVSLGFDPRRFGGDPPPGRAVVDGRLVQLALVGSAGDSHDRFEELVRLEVERVGDRRAPAVQRLGIHIESGQVVDTRPSNVRPQSSVLIGIGDADLAPRWFDLAHGNLLISGPLRSGRTTALGSVALSLSATDPQAPLILVTPRPSPLAKLGIWSQVVPSDGIDEFVATIDADSAAVVFVDDATDLADASDAALAQLATLSRQGRLRIVAAAESSRARSSYGGIVAELRRDRRALLLQPDAELDGDLAGVRLRRRRGPLPVGRGELVERGVVELVQVVVASGLVRGTSPLSAPEGSS